MFLKLGDCFNGGDRFYWKKNNVLHCWAKTRKKTFFCSHLTWSLLYFAALIVPCVSGKTEALIQSEAQQGKIKGDKCLSLIWSPTDQEYFLLASHRSALCASSVFLSLLLPRLRRELFILSTNDLKVVNSRSSLWLCKFYQISISLLWDNEEGNWETHSSQYCCFLILSFTFPI